MQYFSGGGRTAWLSYFSPPLIHRLPAGYGEPVVPDFEIPYHTEIMEKVNGIDLDAARKVAGNGFYYLMGDIARLHSCRRVRKGR